MMRKIFSTAMVFLALCGVQAIAGETDKEKAAVSAAEKWLGMIDDGKYAESWKEAAEYFRNALKQDQ